VIPAETFEWGRVPADHTARIEELLREQEVIGYNLAPSTTPPATTNTTSETKGR